ncbi:MAG: hypothetical protein RL263_536 [Bacteroidota bacterium]|jgi:chorismate mutase
MDELKQSLEELKKQLKGLSAELKEVSNDIIEAKFSEYPIFVAHQENARIGELLFDRTEYGFAYSINATTLERLIELNIIQEDKLADFKKAYGDVKKNYCVLWLKGEFTRFVFMPF